MIRTYNLALLGALAISTHAQAETKTVSWFLAHPAERTRVHQLCMDNPGEAKRVPDCLNAAAAIEQSAAGGFISRIPVKSLAQICAEMPAYQRPFNRCGDSR